MAKKIIGYVKLYWVCPNCAAKNPGEGKTCSACGAPQPANVQFEQAQDAELIGPQAAVTAPKGADTHCPYCGTRNPAGAESCAQCGGDLKEGTSREAGRIIGAYQTPSASPRPEVACPACATPNPAGAATCRSCGALLPGIAPSRENPPQGPATPAPGRNAPSPLRPWMALPLIAILLVCCVIVGFFLFRTETKAGMVQDVSWQRVIAIESLRDVTRRDWVDDIPSGAQARNCQSRVFEKVDSPRPNAQEVCGTPYTVDTGTGMGEVQQDCYYEVYKDYCEYTAQEWQVVEEARASGDNMNPTWPQVQLAKGQRVGAKTAKYVILFETASGVKSFETDNDELFVLLKPGTEWLLVINSFGAVVEVQPLP